MSRHWYRGHERVHENREEHGEEVRHKSCRQGRCRHLIRFSVHQDLCSVIQSLPRSSTGMSLLRSRMTYSWVVNLNPHRLQSRRRLTPLRGCVTLRLSMTNVRPLSHAGHLNPE
jgi:hypothetical protein